MVRHPKAIQATLVLVLAVAAGAGCKKQIGDDCTTAADCNPNGSRSCDQTQPGGYCTIQGCDETSCPSEAVCMRFFPAQFLTKACNPTPDGGPPGAGTADAASPDTGSPDAGTPGCNADETCLDEGLCAPLSTELRYCVKSCSTGGDCRDGYECRLAGTRGSMALTSDPKTVVRFCAPASSG